jgi:hypothetical protein
MNCFSFLFSEKRKLIMQEIILTAYNALKSLGLSIQGKTQHLGWNKTDSVVRPVSINVDNLLRANLSSNEYDYLNSMEFALSVRQYIRSCSWWKVGNDQQVAVSNDEPVGILQDTIWRILMWSIDNSPLDNYQGGYSAMTEIFNESLYQYLDSINRNDLIYTCDYIFSGMTNSMPAIYDSNSVDSILLNKVNFLLGKKNVTTNTSNTSNTSNKSNNSIFIFAGILILVGVFMIGKK